MIEIIFAFLFFINKLMHYLVLFIIANFLNYLFMRYNNIYFIQN